MQQLHAQLTLTRRLRKHDKTKKNQK